MSHKDEATDAIRHVRDQIDSDVPITGRTRFILGRSLDFALAEMEYLTDRRPRKDTAATGQIPLHAPAEPANDKDAGA